MGRAADRPAAPTDRLTATLALDEPVTAVPQVSAQRARALRKLGVETVRDLLGLYPRRYLDMSQVFAVAAAPIGSPCTIRGTVFEVKVKKPRPNLVLAEVTVTDDTGTLMVTAFRQPWLADTLAPGTPVAVSGKVEFNYGFKRMTNPFIDVLSGPGDRADGVILPVHPLTGSITAGIMRRIIEGALERVRGTLDPLPLSLRAKYRLMSRQNALACIHFPHAMEEQRQARRRLAYEEVLLLELSLMREEARRQAGCHPTAHRVDGPALEVLEAALPFQLTAEQQQAKTEILSALAEPRAASHLLLGDVGTGKTAVAAFALVAVADSGGQALFMAPTEILAQQHGATVGPLLEAAGISWGVLTGSTASDQRADMLDRLGRGELSVLFGTHALLEPDVRPARCTLAVIDEQQRFGVEQRQELLRKGECPDALFLTATPIPRTLALTLFGNIGLSYLRERPLQTASRQTFLHTRDDKGAAYDAAREALGRGEQVYVVCPLVGVARAGATAEKSGGKPAAKEGGVAALVDEDAYVFGDICIEEEADMGAGTSLASAQSEAAFLASKVFCDWEVGLLHGRMAAAEKAQVMERFRQGEIQVLVATTVIEVGVDVPNATVMVVEDADRFGLAQLHQLRGRVGRGSAPAQVHLVSGTRNPVALERLAAMERTDDGFELAAFDLSLRREGDILGNRQHGTPVLKLVNVVRDQGLIQAAWQDARAIVAEDPELTSAAYRPLAREAAVVYRHADEVTGG